MPALLTRISTRPKASSAALTIRSAFCGSLIESVDAIACAAGLLDFVDHLLRRAGVVARAFEARADVADDDARALLRHQQRNAAPDAARRAGDDGDLAGNDVWHFCVTLHTHSIVTPGLDPGVHDDAKAAWIAGSSPAMTNVKNYFPHTSSATSTMRRSFAHCSSSVSVLPSSVEAKPHWPEMQS